MFMVNFNESRKSGKAISSSGLSRAGRAENDPDMRDLPRFLDADA